MILEKEVLLREARDAKKYEMKGLVAPGQSQTLESLLRDAYAIRLPKPIDYHSRSDLVRVFNTMAKGIFGNRNDFPSVKVFGSFLMDMFSGESDLDLSVNFSEDMDECPRDKKKRVLRKFAKKLYALQARGDVFSVQLILNARVPIVKVTDRGSGIECDISVENRDGIERSQIVRLISSIDERFKKLGFLMKAWASRHKINNSRERTLNSLSIIYLVAFHLQTRDPPILPPFSALLRDGTDPTSVGKRVQSYLNYGKNNKESLGDLFITLLGKLESVKTLWSKGLCASTYEGSWVYKTWHSGVGCISIEDFTVRSENVARAVGAAQVQRIYQCINRSLMDLVAFNNGHIQGLELMECLFGKDPSSSQEGERESARRSKNKAPDWPVPSDSIQAKKMRFAEAQTSSNLSRLPFPLGSIQTKKAWFAEAQTSSSLSRWPIPPGSIQTEKMQFAGGEARPNSHPPFAPWTPCQVRSPAVGLGDRRGPLGAVPSVLVQQPQGLEGQFGFGQAVQPALPLPNSAGFGGSFNMNPTVLLTHPRPNYVQHCSQPRSNREPGRAQCDFNHRMQGHDSARIPNRKR